jgi:hypothetical protein
LVSRGIGGDTAERKAAVQAGGGRAALTSTQLLVQQVDEMDRERFVRDRDHLGNEHVTVSI